MTSSRNLTAACRILLAVLFLRFDVTDGSALEWGDSSSARRRTNYGHAIISDTIKRQHENKRIDGDGDMSVGLGMLDSSFPGAQWRRRGKTTTSSSQNTCTSTGSMTSVQLVNRVKMWPPWPLSLLQKESGGGGENNNNNESSSKSDDDQVVTASNTYPSAAAIALAWCTVRARVGIRQLEEVGSSLWFHLPPTLPPLLLVASLPRKVGGSGDVAVRKIIPLFSDPFARTLVLGGLGVAVLSWAHQELNRKQRLAPLGLPYRESSVSRVFLPPFLPEMVPEPEIEALQQTTSSSSNSKDSLGTGDPQIDDDNDDDEAEDPSQIFSMLNPRLRKHLSDIYESTPLIGGNNNGNNPLRRRGFFREWRRTREVQKREAAKIRRATIFDELVALQAIKRKSAQRARKPKSGTGDDEQDRRNPVGFALVTGASQGIGRALAVELARWEIPLVLVARDLDRLTSLAYDLEACYGVRCCVLQADLSEIDAAERIHETTTNAGLPIDILVNNAGIAYEGLSANMDTSLIERMIMINTMSFAKLSKLYGQDMIRRGRGRMLMVSSMAGLTSASPNTALYGATKSFERSLAFSMSKEFEPYGVGVTCLMPGPVTNTQFRARSGTGRALCWYLPFYPRPAETVAHQGIISLLDGDTQVLPGWQNRAFAQLFRPILPQRVETMCVQAAWSPFQLPSLGSLFGKHPPPPITELSSGGLVNTAPSGSIQLDLRPRYSFQMPPLLLQLPTKLIPTPPVEPIMPEPEKPAEASRHIESSPSVESNDDTGISSPGTDEEEREKKADDDIKLSPTPAASTSRNSDSDPLPSGPTESTNLEKVATPPTTSESPAHSPSVPTPVAQRKEIDTMESPNPTIEATPANPSISTYQLDEPEADRMPAKSETIGRKRHKRQARKLWPLVEDEDEDGDNISDLYVTPRLGPIDLFQEQRNYSFPNSSGQTISPTKPKWTVQT